MKNSTDIYCNPLSLPDLPRGRYSGAPTEFEAQFSTSADFDRLFMGQQRRDFRESGDPEVLFHDGYWYLYGSSRDGRGVWRSEDFVNWKHFKLELDAEDGYAPTITACNGKFYLSFSLSPLYESDSPLGPFHSLGFITDPAGNRLNAYLDPGLFTDDDGRMYVYWGYGPQDGGIFGAELDSSNLPFLKSEPKFLIDFNSGHQWERFGENYEHPDFSSVEGASMFKRNGIYYLLYSANSATARHYANGCYRATSPLGPFVYGEESPYAIQPHGMVTAPGHGGFVRGPGDTVWYFYSVCIRRVHMFERRIGMDRVQFLPDGKINVAISSIPMLLDGTSAGWLPVSVNKPVKTSSFAFRNFGNYAVDDCTHTWWEPLPEDPEPTLEINLRGEFELAAFRILWSEDNLDYDRGITPEPVKYKIELLPEKEKEAIAVLDYSDNSEDRIVDFRTFAPIRAARVRLRILRGNDKICHGVTQLTIFGFSIHL